MSKEFRIRGCVEVEEDITIHEFVDEFIAWLESKGWYFGGGFEEVKDE